MNTSKVMDMIGKIEECTENRLGYEETLYKEMIMRWKFAYRTARTLIRMVDNSDISEEEEEFLFQPELYKNVDKMVEFARSGLMDLVPEEMFMNPEFLKRSGITELPAYFMKDYKLPYSFVVLEGIKTIGAHAFEGCEELQKVIIDDGLVKIGKEAFRGTGIREIRMPDTVKKIRQGAFRDCKHLTTVRIPKDLLKIESDTFNGDDWIQGMNLGRSIYVGDRAFKGCAELKFPDIKAMSLGEESFYGCRELRKIILGAQCIPKNAFAGCGNLTTVVFESVPHEIREGAFMFCQNLSLATFAGFEYETYGIDGITELMRNASPIIKNTMSMDIKTMKDIHKTLEKVME